MVAKLHFSDSFRIIIKSIFDNTFNSVSGLFLNAIDHNLVKFSGSISFIDITDNDNLISYSDVSKLNKFYIKYKAEFNYSGSFDDLLKEISEMHNYKLNTNSFLYKASRVGRGVMKIGKLVNTLFPLYNISPTELEHFVCLYRSYISDEEYTNLNWALVSGNDISYYYKSKNMKISSCMVNKSDKIYNIYINNPEVCQMLVLHESRNSNLGIGRALLWKLNNGKYFMDQIYCTSSEVYKFFCKKGAELGAINRHLIDLNQLNLEVKIKTIHKPKLPFFLYWIMTYSKYPFMDTLSCYNINTNTLSNKRSYVGKSITLRSITGSYYE